MDEACLGCGRLLPKNPLEKPGVGVLYCSKCNRPILTITPYPKGILGFWLRIWDMWYFMFWNAYHFRIAGFGNNLNAMIMSVVIFPFMLLYLLIVTPFLLLFYKDRDETK